MHDALFATLVETHEALRDQCTRFALEHIRPHCTEWEEAGSFPRELYVQAAEASVLAPSWPEQYGGGGGDVLHAVVAGEALLRGGSTGTVVGLASYSIALPPILNLGDASQKQRFIKPVLSGVRADLVTVLARTREDPHGGLTFFVVERDMPGFRVSRAQ